MFKVIKPEYVSFLTPLNKAEIPEWVKYSLPDGLWVLSYMLFMNIIWDNRTTIGYFWIFCLPIIALLSEFGQLFHIVPGTFDAMDLLCYGLPIMVYVSILKLKSK